MNRSDLVRAAREAAAYKAIESSFEALNLAYKNTGVTTHAMKPKDEEPDSDLPKVSNGSGGFV